MIWNTTITKRWTILTKLFPVKEFRLTEINLRVSRLLRERRAELQNAIDKTMTA